MAKQIFNVIGPRDTVEKLMLKFGFTVKSDFSYGSDTSDYNVEVDDSQVDELVEWCEDNNVKCELV